MKNQRKQSTTNSFVIFQRGVSPLKGSVNVGLLQDKVKKASKTTFQKASLLVLSSVLAVSNYSISRDILAVKSRQELKTNITEVLPQDTGIEVKGESEESAFGVGPDFSIVIPKVQAISNIEADIDPFDPLVYKEALKKGIAHAQGSGKPGEGKSVFLFAHSTDSILNFDQYNAVFYKLRTLNKGDFIYVFYKSKKFTYRVSTKHIVSADDTSWLLVPRENEVLLLQTCEPPGTTWKRLIVEAQPYL